MKYSDFCRTDIEFLEEDQFREACLNLPYRRIILILSQQAAERYQMNELVEQMQQRYQMVWMKQSVSYPTQRMLHIGLSMLSDFEPEVVLSVGGGSAIDFAKAMKAFGGFEEVPSIEMITELLQKKEIRGSRMDLIAVPTTAGTGAELTKWATVWDDAGNVKYSIDHDTLKPDKAYIVPAFTAKADKKLTISTGLDSMAHALEAYWSRKTSPLVRVLSKTSVEMTLANLQQILENPADILLREKQCTASVLSGLAFSMTRTTASHSISYPLTMGYGIAHGIAVAMTLAQIAEHNHGAFPEEDALMVLFVKYGGIRRYLEMICGETVSLNLRDYGIAEEMLEEIAGKSFTLGRMDNNAVELNQQDVIQILRTTY